MSQGITAEEFVHGARRVGIGVPGLRSTASRNDAALMPGLFIERKRLAVGPVAADPRDDIRG